MRYKPIYSYSDMKLVIVESPNKCHTIQRYLGDEYVVLASKGHIRDLSTSGKGGYGVDVNNDFKASYVITKSKYPTVNELKNAARQADEVLLATDPDREGEAIAWHLSQVLGLDPKTTKRLEFHEITRASISEAIKHPRTIDMNLVNSQETRRIIDRIMGFKLSGLVQKKIKSKSAGRVQSATLKMITDHDKEIEEFVPEEYWRLVVEFNKNNRKFSAEFDKCGEIKEIPNKETNDKILAKLGKEIVVKEIKKSVKSVESKPAFTTSSLQQEAFNVYHFSTKKTSELAQELYEGINLGDEHVGLITYIRTDSTYLSDTFVERATNFITETFGKEYVGKRKIVKQAQAQNAHEAIRPTSNHRTPESIKGALLANAKSKANDLYKLYKLIYERTLASLMVAKKESVEKVTFESNGVEFKSEFSSTIFDGYTKIYSAEKQDDKVPPKFVEGEILEIKNVVNEQKFTQPPAKLNEAKVVKLMEEKGIGRPSTYASTIDTLLKRKYIESKQGQFETTEQGKKTSIVLNKYFPSLIDVKYTARMESYLDKIQEGEISRSDVLHNFYDEFTKIAEEASKKMYKDEDVPVGRKCPKCGSELVIKKGKFGEFIGCSNFPECDYCENETQIEYTGEMCPVCGKPLVYRRSKKGKKFVACSNYPHCDYIKNEKKPLEVVGKCPECGGDLVKRTARGRTIIGCSNYPKCHHIEYIKKAN